MRLFKLDKNRVIICERKNTRNGFKHEATLLSCSFGINSTKICYLNRTWEVYEFQSVIKKLIDKANELTDKEKKRFMKKF